MEQQDYKPHRLGMRHWTVLLLLAGSLFLTGMRNGNRRLVPTPTSGIPPTPTEQIGPTSTSTPTVEDTHTPTPTHTSTPTGTPTVTTTKTNTPDAPTSTSTPTATATRPPTPKINIFLPVIQKESGVGIESSGTDPF